jgi:hypothetical protein
MAAGKWTIPLKALLALFQTAGLAGANASNYRMALVASTWTPNDATDEVWADVSAHEIPAGNGYSTGGIALTGVSLALSGSSVKFTHSAAIWTASGGYIPAVRHVVAYYLGTVNSKVNPLLARCYPEIGPDPESPVPADKGPTPDGKAFTVTAPADGLFSAAQVAP